jgi:hypothetical protein
MQRQDSPLYLGRLSVVVGETRLKKACKSAVTVGSTQAGSHGIRILLIAITIRTGETPPPQRWIDFRHRRLTDRDDPTVKRPKVTLPELRRQRYP